ncbi:retrovirus-related pol polyprotein from transposon TNT 1-94 [Tanacetum coccineum]|uniref:Retrovirus-related pol polyprotein from transposon TNT 1-94 n=1 Tax=Tanacetum coccineum TaxID=301880 RepID=A0ABQ5H8W7_9ASTR
MHSGKKLSEHIYEFNKLIDDLANIDVDINEEDQALMLLTSLPPSYDNFVETLHYGRESLTLEDVLSSLNSRELKKRTNAKDDGDGLYVRGRSDHRGNQGRGSSRSNSKGKGTYKLKCYICYSEDRQKKDCRKKNKKKSTGFVKKNEGQGSGMHSEGYDNGDLLMAMSEVRFLEWIMDSGSSFHMMPRRDFLFDFKKFNGGTVLLGDNRACAIMGIGKVRVQMKDGSSFLLENVRYILDLKRNLISLGTPDRKGYTVKLQNGRVKVIKGSLMFLSGTMKGNYVYSLDGWAESGEASVGIQEKESLAQNEDSASSGGEAVGGKPDSLGEEDAYGQAQARGYKCIFLGYPDGVKGYRLWRLDDGAGVADSGKEVEFEVELQGSRVEPTVDPHTVENLGNEDKEQDEEPQQQNLDNYVLVHDRAKRTTTIPARYRDEGNVSLYRPSGGLKVDDMAAYAVSIAEEEDTHEPITFQDAINSSEKDEWGSCYEGRDEFFFLFKKASTWELDDHPLVRSWQYSGCIRLKRIEDSEPRYKARLVARGFTQRAGIDYNETAFLHGNLEETIYMRQPPGFEEGMGNKSEIEYTKGLLRKEFDMKELGPARKILGMEIVRDRGSRTLKVSQSGYVQKILNNYRMDNGKSVSVPLGAHFKVSLKDCPPDIAYAVSIVSRYLANPGKNHWEAVKWILKYLKGTADVGLVYGRDQGKHVDVDGVRGRQIIAKDPNKGMSITGYVFMVHGCVVSWKATLQHVALFTTEAEYMVPTKAVKESIWLKGLLIELGKKPKAEAIAIHLSRNAMFHERTKHINVRYHFIREIVESKEIEVAKIGTKDNAADAFTKVVPGPKFKYCMKILGVGAN